MSELQLTELKDKTLNQLSGGQLQRVLLAKSLMKDSDLLCLDEPFVGIDFKSEEIMINMLRRLKSEGKLIIIVHHDIQKPNYISIESSSSIELLNFWHSI